MNRLFWGMTMLVLLTVGGWAQSTWRGQAEVWSTGIVPADGFVAASNEFPKNSLLSIENYKTRKTIQVRVVAGLPDGSSAWVLLNPKAAAALDIKAGDAPLVGVRLDPTGIDRPDNPDPDVNPLALRPSPTPAAVPTPGPAPAAAPAVAVVTPPVPVVPAVPLPVPALAPEPEPQPPRTALGPSADLAAATPAVDPAQLPLPAANPDSGTEARTPLAVTDEPEPAAPVTPGKQVFLTTRDPEPVATETPPVTEPSPAAEPASEPAAAPVPAAAPPAPVAEVPAAEPSPVPAPVPVPAVPTPAPVAEAPAPVPSPEPAPVPAPAPVAVVPAPAPVPVPPVVAVAPAAVKLAPASVWVPVPSPLSGPVLGQVPYLAGLDKGKAYVQVGSWASESDVLKVLGTVKSYVPLALYKADGEKNPWRLVVASAPNGQLGVLMMSFRSQGFRSANIVKG